jgi:hypothetical protein
VASKRDDGLVHVELIAHNDETGWLAAEVARLVKTHRPDAVVVDPRTPAGTALPALRARGVRPIEVTSLDAPQAYASFVTACQEEMLRHIDQPELTAALDGAVRRSLGDAWAWSRKSSSVDISPLVACTFALWGVAQHPRRRPGRVIKL